MYALCFKNCSDLSLLHCSSYLQYFAYFLPSASTLQTFSLSLEQFFLTVGMNIFYRNRILNFWTRFCESGLSVSKSLPLFDLIMIMIIFCDDNLSSNFPPHFLGGFFWFFWHFFLSLHHLIRAGIKVTYPRYYKNSN